MKLYEIKHAIEDVLEAAVDPETGEVTDEALMDAYNNLLMDKNDKVENIGLLIKNLESDAAAMRAEAKNLLARANVATNKAEHLRAYLQMNLGEERFLSPRLAISFRHSKHVEVEDMDRIPTMYLRYKLPELDKKMVTDAIKAGKEVPGCALVESVSMIIK